MGDEVREVVRELWKQFNPGNKQSKEFERTLIALSKCGFVSGYTDALNYVQEQNQGFIDLFGNSATQSTGIFINPERSYEAQHVLYEALKNVPSPTGKDGEFINMAERGGCEYSGFRLARKVHKKGRDGLELIVFDKGRGFVDGEGHINILHAIRPGYSIMSVENEGMGLPQSIAFSDEYEIESMGKLWNSRRLVIPFLRPSLVDVPFIKGAKIRTVVYNH